MLCAGGVKVISNSITRPFLLEIFCLQRIIEEPKVVNNEAHQKNMPSAKLAANMSLNKLFLHQLCLKGDNFTITFSSSVIMIGTPATKSVRFAFFSVAIFSHAEPLFLFTSSHQGNQQIPHLKCMGKSHLNVKKGTQHALVMVSLCNPTKSVEMQKSLCLFSERAGLHFSS